MPISSTDEALAIRLISQDVEATIGAAHERAILLHSKLQRELADENDLEPIVYAQSVAERVQQYFHDCFIDTTWPACPIHRRHPLWLSDGTWTCAQLKMTVAKLGELRASRDTTGRYVILVD